MQNPRFTAEEISKYFPEFNPIQDPLGLIGGVVVLRDGRTVVLSDFAVDTLKFN